MIYEKVDTLLWYSQILEKHFLEISVIFDFPCFYHVLDGTTRQTNLGKIQNFNKQKCSESCTRHLLYHADLENITSPILDLRSQLLR